MCNVFNKINPWKIDHSIHFSKSVRKMTAIYNLAKKLHFQINLKKIIVHKVHYHRPSIFLFLGIIYVPVHTSMRNSSLSTNVLSSRQSLCKDLQCKIIHSNFNVRAPTQLRLHKLLRWWGDPWWQDPPGWRFYCRKSAFTAQTRNGYQLRGQLT